jgi:hypothetical protein
MDTASTGSANTAETGATGETSETYSSIQRALESFTDRMAAMESVLDGVDSRLHEIEQPLSVASLGRFTQPTFLESSPFRSTKFRLLPEARALFGLDHGTVSFAELCTAIRSTAKEDLERMLGVSDFLGVLTRLDKIIE